MKQGADLDRADTVHHFHGLWNLSHARIASALRKAGKPYVVSPHGMLEPWAFRNRRWKKVPYFKLIERRLLHGAEALFVTSAMERDHLARVLDHPSVEVLPLGCRDLCPPDYQEGRRRLGWEDDERVILFLSRVDPKKGLHMLFDAMAKSDSSRKLWRVVVVGDGPEDYQAQLNQQLKVLGDRAPKVEWLGPVWGDERWPFLQAADLFCLPTHSENFGIAVLEAFHVGTPVLTTTGTPWVEQREMDGVFIADPNEASIQEVLDAASERLGGGWSPEDRNRLAGWADENFAWAKLAGRYQEAYRHAMKSKTK